MITTTFGVFAYALFPIAGLFFGGAWSLYKNENTMMAAIFAVLALMALLAGIMWLVGEMH
ncbi:hypothetical protein [Corynebacterium sp. HS2168-gen11]|uniref:hypothetical protein n=1 Tax=Corynebacterium sp. HS2168-gen11 TaxID=2974027 RepID=UPI00216AF69B|nr:hypothetical protein [Corynebacterium sp. HS2168-gen11]MCS4536242.1 hypothetical protein [Corynebacterium sp. HS2168-gen11]